MTFLQKRGASWLKFVRLGLSLVSSLRLQEKKGGGTMVLIVDVPAGIKPLAADDSMRILHGWKMRLWCLSAFVDQCVTNALFGSL